MGIRTLSPSDAEGKMFLNRGEANPVVDVDAAHTMAIAENKAFDQHRRKYGHRIMLETIKADAGVANRVEEFTNTMQTAPLADMAKAGEKSRIRIAINDVERAKTLYHLEEITDPTLLGQVELTSQDPEATV